MHGFKAMGQDSITTCVQIAGILLTSWESDTFTKEALLEEMNGLLAGQVFTMGELEGALAKASWYLEETAPGVYRIL